MILPAGTAGTAARARMWHRPAVGARPRYRLVCIPHAGGGTAAYQPWLRLLPRDVEVCVIRLPGRESRMSRPPHSDFGHAVSEIADLLSGLPPIPWALYGHSMGGLLAYEVCGVLAGGPLPEPLCLAVGGTAAPPRHADLPPWLPPGSGRRDVVNLLKRFGGTPQEVFDNPEMLNLVLKMVESDFLMLDTYRPGTHAVRCPLFAFAGTRDTEVTPADVAAWQHTAAGSFELRLLDAGHFFAYSHAEAVVPYLDSRLRATGA
ncbi:thioesterase II family protein [Streptomyces sp. NBC_00102]|uniref:thioesterase II family protein n=1 Tax=Streptomyces sp. NBC_00102 TaxID=2975652 RepID=UPI0022526F52|nr:alpha/beta fold hydrolase [Streptomyces sp. NBC_00102]MCX5395487.1 alpha/beta fold hydrolase [Streptomyces sp. NBC_00102]